MRTYHASSGARSLPSSFELFRKKAGQVLRTVNFSVERNSPSMFCSPQIAALSFNRICLGSQSASSSSLLLIYAFEPSDRPLKPFVRHSSPFLLGTSSVCRFDELTNYPVSHEVSHL